MNRFVLLFLSALGLGACATESPIVQPTPLCQGEIFDLPIEDVVAGKKFWPTVLIHVAPFGQQRVTLDTGTSLNTVMAPDVHYVQEKLTWQKLKNLFSPELNHHVPFYKMSISGTLADIIEERGLGPLIVNPQIIDESGFTVMDLKHKRLIGFRDETTLRSCYGHGQRAHLGKIGVAYNMSLVDVTLDGRVSGLGLIDTGAFLTEFYSPQISAENAKPSQELSRYLINGDLIVPQVSPNHTIKIGGKVKTLGVVGVAASKPTQFTDGSVGTEDGSIATIGYDALQGSVLIFPPKSAGYWELIF